MASKRPQGAGARYSQGARHAPQPVPRVRRSSALYAALDLGTNSCRMLIAVPRGAGFRVVDSFSKSVQLGLELKSSVRL